MITCYVKGCLQSAEHNTTFPNNDNVTVCDEHHDEVSELIWNSKVEVDRRIRELKLKIRDLNVVSKNKGKGK